MPGLRAGQGVQLELDQRLRITRRTIRDFVAVVRRRMLRNPYHNWRHVADVTQTAYALASTSGLMRSMPDRERLALLMAALCHDLQHPVRIPPPPALRFARPTPAPLPLMGSSMLGPAEKGRAPALLTAPPGWWEGVATGRADSGGRRQGVTGPFLVKSGSDMVKGARAARGDAGCLELHHRYRSHRPRRLTRPAGPRRRDA